MARKKSARQISEQWARIQDSINKRYYGGTLSETSAQGRWDIVNTAANKYTINIAKAQKKDVMNINPNKLVSRNAYMGLNQG